MNFVLSAILTVGKYEGITWSISTRWCVLSGIQNLQSTGYPSECGSLHIPCNIYIAITVIKIYTQHVYKLHGSDFIYNSFGENENFRHKNSKAFFSLQKTLIKPPPKAQFPDWKSQPILVWMDSTFPLIWILGVTFSMD